MESNTSRSQGNGREGEKYGRRKTPPTMQSANGQEDKTGRGTQMAEGNRVECENRITVLDCCSIPVLLHCVTC